MKPKLDVPLKGFRGDICRGYIGVHTGIRGLGFPRSSGSILGFP